MRVPLRSITLVAALGTVTSARAAHAQELFERLGLDRLRLTAIGVEAGPVAPSRTVATMSYALHADYGEIAPNWRVVFTATYWGTRFTDATVRRFEDELRPSLANGADSVRIGKVTVSDIALEGDLRWTPLRTGIFRPFLGGGVGAHVINAENPYINNTFVESALDQIAAGFSAVGGTDLALGDRVIVGVQGRYTLLSTVRFGTVRAYGSYIFSRDKPAK